MKGIGHEETSSIPQWCLSGGCATFNAGGFVGDEVRVVQSARMGCRPESSSSSGRGGLIPKSKLRERFTMFADGQWFVLLRQGQKAPRTHKAGVLRRRRRQCDSVEKRAERAQALVELGELSSTRQVLEGATCAPGDETTKNALSDPSAQAHHTILSGPGEVLEARQEDIQG